MVLKRAIGLIDHLAQSRLTRMWFHKEYLKLKRDEAERFPDRDLTCPRDCGSQKDRGIRSIHSIQSREHTHGAEVIADIALQSFLNKISGCLPRVPQGGGFELTRVTKQRRMS